MNLQTLLLEMKLLNLFLMNESENPSFVQGPSTLTRMLATYLSQLSSPGQAPSTITCMTMTYLSQLPP